MDTIHPNPIVGQAKAIVFVLVFSIILYLAREHFNGHFLLLLAIAWALAIAAIVLLYILNLFISLEVGESDLLYRKGILNTKKVLVPYSRITDTRYAQSLAERIFGVGTLEVDTAGDSSISIIMPGVNSAHADAVMNHIRKNPKMVIL